MAYQIQGFDLPSIFLAAQQARAAEQSFRMNQMRMQQAEQQQQRQALIDGAWGAAAQGDPRELMQLDPKGWIEFQQAKAQQDAARIEAENKRAKAAAEMTERTANFLANVPPEARDDLQALAPFQRAFDTGASAGVYSGGDLRNPSIYGPALAQVQATQQRNITGNQSDVAASLGLDPRNPATYQHPDFQRAMSLWSNPSKSGASSESALDILRTAEGFQITKDTHALDSAYQRILNASMSGPGAVSAFFNFMKMVDPGSVVRENEFDAIRASSGLLSGMISGFMKLKDGSADPAQIMQLREEARRLVAGQHAAYSKTEGLLRDIALSRGLDPALVLPRFSDAHAPVGDKPARPAEIPLGAGAVNPMAPMPTQAAPGAAPIWQAPAQQPSPMMPQQPAQQAEPPALPPEDAEVSDLINGLVKNGMSLEGAVHVAIGQRKMTPARGYEIISEYRNRKRAGGR